MGFVELVAVGIGFGLVALAVVVRGPPLRPRPRRPVVGRGLRRAPHLEPTRPSSATYLRTGRRLRFVCSVAGFVLPPLVVRAVDPDLAVGRLVRRPDRRATWSGRCGRSCRSPARRPEPPRAAALVAPPARGLPAGPPALGSPGRSAALATVLGGRRGPWSTSPTYPSVTGAGLADRDRRHGHRGGRRRRGGAAVDPAPAAALRRARPRRGGRRGAVQLAPRPRRQRHLRACCSSAIAPAVVLADSDVQLLRWTMPWLALASLIGSMVAVRYYVYRAWRVRRPELRLAVGG